MYAPRTLALFLLSIPTRVIKIAVDDRSVKRDDWQHIETRHTRGDCRVRCFAFLDGVRLFPSRSLTLAFIFVPRAIFRSLGFQFEG
jgi:hypothetical protein